MNEILKKITSKGYWHVIIRPTENFYKKNRFEISELGKVFNESQIHLRGWSYPFNVAGDANFKAIGQNAIGNSTDYKGFIEYWRFFTSGQFEQYFSIREDFTITEEQLVEIKNSFTFSKEVSKEIKKVFEVVNAVYRFTEIYLFASNISQQQGFEDVSEFEIIIELNGVDDRMLFIFDNLRQLYSPYICGIEDGKIIFKDNYKKDELIAKSNEFAIEKAVKTFIFFDWKTPNEQAIREDQKKLLERRL